MRVVRFDILGMNHWVSEKGSVSLSSHIIWMKMYSLICLYCISPGTAGQWSLRPIVLMAFIWIDEGCL